MRSPRAWFWPSWHRWPVREIGAFALLMVLLGRIGTVELAASGIAFNLNMIVFMPMLGLGVGVCAVVGRHLGAGRTEAAERTTWSAFWMSLGYMSLCGLLYLAAPGLLMAPYAAGADPATFPAVAGVATVLLRLVIEGAADPSGLVELTATAP